MIAPPSPAGRLRRTPKKKNKDRMDDTDRIDRAFGEESIRAIPKSVFYLALLHACEKNAHKHTKDTKPTARIKTPGLIPEVR
jgi:hypothetical protein